MPGVAAQAVSQAMPEEGSPSMQTQSIPNAQAPSQSAPQKKKPLRQQLEEAHQAEYGQANEKSRLIQLTQEGLAMLQRLNQGR